MRSNGIDFITLSPLVLLASLPLSDWLVQNYATTASHPGIAGTKYFSIPLVGFSVGAVLFLGIVRNNWELPARLSSYIERHTTRVILLLACMSLIYLASLAILRYTSLHTFAFELGTYDRKIWRISAAALTMIPSEAALYHFQPILVFHALIYDIIDSPIVVQALQAVTMISGIIPLYLIAKEHLRKPLLVFLTTTTYLLYPPVEFNATLDFHPDHIYVPLLLWAFYFAERGKYWKGIFFAGLAAMAKETLILGTAFFGLYIILANRRYLLGAATFVIFSLLFFILISLVLPSINHRYPLQNEAFPFLSADPNGSISRTSTLINTIFMLKAKKLLFIYLLLAPMLFLPLLDWRRFLPAIPLICIPLLSAESLHSTADSQYTAGIIAPAFVAFIFSLKRLEERCGAKYTEAAALFVLTMTLTFNIANGPSPISINFWKAGWSEIWHRSAFTKGEHDKTIKEAIYRIPADPNMSVTSQGNVNHARLAHRYKYWEFDSRWKEADYIIFDTNRPLMMGDKVNAEAYRTELEKIQNSPDFRLEFKRDGVLLFKKLLR